MRVLGFEFKLEGNHLIVARAAPQPTSPLYGDRGNWWFPVIREPFTGGWQKNFELRVENVVTYFAVYSCISLISTDVGKLGLRLMRRTDTGLLIEATSAATA